jgi:NAD(P)-dependent dehydrogenase (short-subunit alcohol dehydrogenase family)
MGNSGILAGKTTLIFGAGGSLGAAVASEFAAEGAEVFLSGRSAATVEEVAKGIDGRGGKAHVDVVDASDTHAVDEYLGEVVARAGRIDAVCNLTGPRVGDYRNGAPIVQLPIDAFMLPQETVLRSQFITAQACARRMVEQGSGVLIFVTGSPAHPHGPGAAGIGAAFAAIENLMRTLAIELGSSGVRSVGLRIAANPDTRTIQDTTRAIAEQIGSTQEAALARLEAATMLGRSPRAADTARAAAFLASDQSRMMTGTVMNSSAGAVWD